MNRCLVRSIRQLTGTKLPKLLNKKGYKIPQCQKNPNIVAAIHRIRNFPILVHHHLIYHHKNSIYNNMINLCLGILHGIIDIVMHKSCVKSDCRYYLLFAQLLMQCLIRIIYLKRSHLVLIRETTIILYGYYFNSSKVLHSAYFVDDTSNNGELHKFVVLKL